MESYTLFMFSEPCLILLHALCNYVCKFINTYPINLIQEQYIFIHDAVLEAVTYGDTQITARDLREAIQQLDQQDPQTHTTGFENQFKVGDIHKILSCYNAICEVPLEKSVELAL